MEDTFIMDLQNLEEDIEQLIVDINDTAKEESTLTRK